MKFLILIIFTLGVISCSSEIEVQELTDTQRQQILEENEKKLNKNNIDFEEKLLTEQEQISKQAAEQFIQGEIDKSRESSLKDIDLENNMAKYHAEEYIRQEEEKAKLYAEKFE